MHGEDVAIASRGISFEDEARVRHNLTFSVAASLKPYQEQLWSFRQRLFGWFVGLAVLLLATLGALLRWVLAPVRRLEREITRGGRGHARSAGRRLSARAERRRHQSQRAARSASAIA